jgi:twitching motility protein PilT
MIIREEQIKKIILSTSTPKAREILGHQRQVTYAENVDEIGRLRFSAFFDRGRFAVSLRVISNRFIELEDLGINELQKKSLFQHSGLVLVGSPSCEGKSTTIASILNYYNQNFQKSIYTIENPVEFVYKDDKAAFIQRSIPVDISNFYTGLCEAYRVDPDIVVTDSIAYADTMNQALNLCESGCTVIAATEGGDCLQIIERLIGMRVPEDRDNIRQRLSTHLKMIISQRLVPLADNTGRKIIFDILINNAQMKALIKNNNMSMFRTIQGNSESIGMRTFDNQLKNLLRRRVITQKTANEFAIDKNNVLV